MKIGMVSAATFALGKVKSSSNKIFFGVTKFAYLIEANYIILYKNRSSAIWRRMTASAPPPPRGIFLATAVVVFVINYLFLSIKI